MTDEELEARMKEIETEIARLPESGKGLTKAEKKLNRLLQIKKTVLERIKEAKQKHQVNDEIHYTMVYGVTTSWVSKHPYLMHLLLNMKFVRRMY